MNALNALAEASLSDRFGGRVRLSVPEALTDAARASQVYRCRVTEAPAGAPASVILKQRVADISVPRFLNDWAGAAFLTRREAPTARFYGADRRRYLLILEDLGEGGGLDRLLTGTDPAAATAALEQMARSLGQMHAATAGAAHEYRSLRQGLRSWYDLWPGRFDLRLLHMHTWFRWQAPLAVWKAGVDRGPAFTAAASGLIRRLGSGPLVAYNQGDPCPDNWRLTATGPRLIDFEAGGMRSALMDGAYFRMLFPTCWCAGRIPAPVVAHLERAYREELSWGCPAAGDDQTWRAGMADACAYWAWFTVATRLPQALAGDARWGIATVRPRILARLSSFLDASAGLADLDGLRRPAQALLEELTRRWGTTDLPLYPCFP